MLKTSQIIEGYRKAGFSLFPLGNWNNVKAPRDKNWQNREYQDSELTNIFGVKGTPDTLFIDYDPRRDDNGATNGQLIEFYNSIGLGKQETFMVQSQSGGRHIYYRIQPLETGYHFPRKVAGFPAIDIKSMGEYVVGAGSQFTDDEGTVKQYTVYRYNPSVIIQAPPELIAGLKPRFRDVSLPKIEHFNDDEATRTQFIRYLMQPYALTTGTYQTACEGRAYGLSPETVYDLMQDYYNCRRTIPKTEDELKHKIRNAYSYGQTETGARSPEKIFENFAPDVQPIKPGTPKYPIKWVARMTGGTRELISCMQNVVNHFTMDLAGEAQIPNPLLNALKLNLHSGYIEFNHHMPWHDKELPVPLMWTTQDTLECVNWLGFECHYRADKMHVKDAAYVVAARLKYHPIKTWLGSLPKWDGETRIDKLFTHYCGGEDTKLNRAIAKNMMIGLIARIYDPGCQHDTMVVLEGEQGIGKGKFCKTLGGPWHLETEMDTSKDGVARMRQGWLIEIPEMEFVDRKEVKVIRGFMTRKLDYVRMPYAENVQPYERASIFIGTANPEKHGYFTDPTGNRRFEPVWVDWIDNDAVARDRDQLFAEALQRYREGENHYLDTDELVNEAKTATKKRMAYDPWQDEIEVWLSTVTPDVEMTTSTIMSYALGMPVSREAFGMQRISRIMCGLGYTLRQIRVGKRRARVWEKDI